MAENKLADMSTEFAIQILKLTENIKGHYSLSNQLERSGTSIGANIREAIGAIAPGQNPLRRAKKRNNLCLPDKGCFFSTKSVLTDGLNPTSVG